ncbi:hypothetical protein BASA81_001597 [Batrachochytrium salamandrivorans]|nr:hypothetical protein BASA81_001597 [Batrachochytrium salamandrivorans]
MGNSLAATLDRTAMLMSKDDDERKKTLAKLAKILDPSNLQTNKTRSRTVLDNKAVMGVLFNLSATTSSADVAEAALWVFRRLAWDPDNVKRLFQEYPSLLPVAMRKLEFGTENATEGAQIKALDLLKNLAFNDDNAREMATKNTKLVPLLVAKAESNSEQVQIKALGVLKDLANNVDNKHEMVTQNPTLVRLLVAKTESDSEQVQEEALKVLLNLTSNVENRREMFAKNPTLIPLLVAKAESDSEQVQIKALIVLQNLAVNVDNKREMFTKYPTLVPLLVAKAESNSEQVQKGALEVLNNLAINVDNAAEMMATSSAVLLPLLVAKMNGNAPLEATKMIYSLSCSPANRAILRGNDSVVAALTKGRENKDFNTSFFSLLALINLCGAEEDSKVLKTDLAMLRLIFKVIAYAINTNGWDLNSTLLAFRYLCVVEHNRQLLWGEYGSEFLTRVLAALQRAIEDKNTAAAENAMSTLAQFSNDAEPLVWMRSNKSRLDKVIAQLAPFPDALKTAQFILLAVDPPKVVAAPTPVAGSKPTIMISYNWKHQAQARLIHSLLESQGYSVWRDEQNMKADIMTAMADAVSKSTVVLVLVSPFYRESANCQMECQFAHNNNRKLIPVLVEPGYAFKADGWLGLLLGSKLYYDVSGSQMEPVILNLLRSEVEGGQVAATVAPPVAAAPKQPVPQNEAEIRQWLSKHKHGEEVADKLVKEGLVEVEALEMLSKLSPTELKSLVELNTMQALTLSAALKELF